MRSARSIGLLCVPLLAGLACGHAPARPPGSWIRSAADNDGVRIEYWVRAPVGEEVGAPIVFVPGMVGDASVWTRNATLTLALDRAGPRRLVAVSLRGRGGSDCPETGWTPEDHHEDLASVVSAERLERYHLVAHSMGVGYAIGFALGRPRGEIRSLVAADYFPAVIEVNEAWATAVEGRAGPVTFDRRLPRHILREQGGRDYAGRLGELGMPLLVILGTRSAEPRLEALYDKAPVRRVRWIEHGHDTFASDDAIRALVEHVVGHE